MQVTDPRRKRPMRGGTCSGKRNEGGDALGRALRKGSESRREEGAAGRGGGSTEGGGQILRGLEGQQGRR